MTLLRLLIQMLETEKRNVTMKAACSCYTSNGDVAQVVTSFSSSNSLYDLSALIAPFKTH